MNVVVTGSLGHIGKPLTEELVQKGHQVTVISSKPEKQNEITQIGAIAAIGSLEDVDFLTATFAGADAIFAMIPPNYAEPDQLAYYRRIGSNYAQAIQRSGVQHVVHLSSYGAHLPKGTGFILGSHHTEGILNELSDVAITHLRPGYFYYNLYGFVSMIKEQGLIGSVYGGDDRLVMVAPSDIATVAAEELTKSATGRNIRYIASDDRTASEVAHVLGNAIGKPDLQWLAFSEEQVTDALLKTGMPASLVANFVELGACIHSGKLRGDYDLHKPTVIGSVKLEDFAKEFAAAFKDT
ncbi:NmrA family NAD(P)-binding protein [Spirosoma foliorum]|uniref:NAD(P)H-binding protein n=1 Tax=Spirosoma foliorum TaxID=2710596 RepID=A0A7G5H0L8_9BACT|nr:NAD(P)H-binding protein [Spirosoma foliorum]QMW04660.1 NAD(P)H-binding protein [Spirosoma foliorum]